MKNKILAVAALLVIVFGISYFASRGNDGSNTDTQTSEQTAPDSSDSGKSVDLSGQQLTTIPESVLNQTDITELNLSNNQIVTLPAEISKLTNLQTLNIENNRLESFPAELTELKALRVIRANNNRLKSITELSSMTWLESLDISGNDEIPEESIQELKNSLPNTEIKS
jgi:Leucine-rich repeat (LRR) protein